MKNFASLYWRVCGVAFAIAVAGIIFLNVPDVSAAPPAEKQCSDGKDNDEDGLTDGADPDCSGGNTGNGQDTTADIYLFHGPAYGIRGDQWIDGDPGDPILNPGGLATLYPANKNLSDVFSCAGAIITDQAQGYVRMFVPAGDGSSCPVPNRYVPIVSDYDLDQDGLCMFPYTGRVGARGFELDYGCVGPEPDGVEEAFATMHLNEVLGPGGTTPAGFQIKLVEYYEGYEPTAGVDPGLGDVAFVGGQERAYVINLTSVTTSIPDPADPVVRLFENTGGTADICQVNWKNGHAKDCEPIEGGVTNMTIMGKVDPTPLP